MKNEDVLFYWSLVSVNWDEPHSNELLQLIYIYYSAMDHC